MHGTKCLRARRLVRLRAVNLKTLENALIVGESHPLHALDGLFIAKGEGGAQLHLVLHPLCLARVIPNKKRGSRHAEKREIHLIPPFAPVHAPLPGDVVVAQRRGEEIRRGERIGRHDAVSVQRDGLAFKVDHQLSGADGPVQRDGLRAIGPCGVLYRRRKRGANLHVRRLAPVHHERGAACAAVLRRAGKNGS